MAADDNKKAAGALPVVVLLLAAVVPPTAAGFTFAHQITQRPWLSLGLALAYEVFVFAVGFATEVGQGLRKRWVERATEKSDLWLQRRLSGYQKDYLQHLIYRHRNFDVKGLTTQGPYNLELERVFVELSLAPQPAHTASADPIHPVPEALRRGRHPIWDFLKSGPGASPNLAVIGAPGSGKTTLLKHMALALASAGKGERRRDGAPERLPILLFLRDHAASIREKADYSLAQAVGESLAKFEGPDAPPGWWEAQIRAGRCLVLLDGLDEVADPEARKGVAAWVERQMSACGGNPFVVTSRPFGYRDNPLGGVTVLEISPFSREQQRQFVGNWYLANEIMSAQKDDPGVQMDARNGAEDLLRRISRAPALSDLAVNPLLLTMIATVHRFRSSLPGRRVELYAEICEVFLGKRQQSKGIELDLTPLQKQRVLQPLAWEMMCRKAREVSRADAEAIIAETLATVSPQTAAEAFLKMIEDGSGLLLQRENGVYGFAHLTFQEYLAAVHAHERQLVDELTTRVEESWWHETLRLYCTRAADASPIIAACLERASVLTLALAAECVEEASAVRPELRARLETLLYEAAEN